MIANTRRSPVPASIINIKDQWTDLILTVNKGDIKEEIYKGTTKVDGEKRHLLREKLIAQYHGKCAYCENVELSPEVEHYRPKKRVSKAPGHPGYYWLCYEWTNLLPSCRYCNTSGGKGNHFPVMGGRVNIPPMKNGLPDFDKFQVNSGNLLDEKPYLLHPEVDDPSRYLRFNHLGKAFGRDRGTGRGKATIEICNLNRDNLLYRRQKIVKDLVEKIEDQFIIYFEVGNNIEVLKAGLKRVFTRLVEACEDDQPFTLMNRNVRDNFKKLIIPRLKTSIQKEFAMTIYDEFFN